MFGHPSNEVKPEVKPADKTPDDVNDFFALEDKPEVKPEVKKDEDKDDDDKNKKPARRDKTDKDDKDDKDDKLDEDDIDLKDEEDEEDEKLELKKEDEIEIDAPPKKREVLAKYPNFFKEFPFFEKLMFRDRQYTELFGSFDDAKEVLESAKVLEGFEADLLRGSTEKILTEIKSRDKKAFDKIVDNYLPTLARVDKEAYFEIVGNVGKQMIKEMVQEAKASSNEHLRDAALLLNQFLFGTSTYSPPKPRVEQKDERSDEVERERMDLVRERFETARGDLQSRVDNTLRATISQYIDPKDQMSAYVKKNAIRDALQSLHQTIGGDTAFRRNLDRLWESAFSDRFSRNSTDRIRSTYLGKAKALLPSIIKKARAEALKDQVPTSRVKEDDDEKSEREERPTRRGPIESGRPRQSGGKNKMEKGESVLDFLSRD